jgi:hypothetical protein
MGCGNSKSLPIVNDVSIPEPSPSTTLNPTTLVPSSEGNGERDSNTHSAEVSLNGGSPIDSIVSNQSIINMTESNVKKYDIAVEVCDVVIDSVINQIIHNENENLITQLCHNIIDDIVVDISDIIEDIDTFQKRERKIQHIKDEILSTERTYVNNMKLAHEVYILPLLSQSIIDPIIHADQFKDFLIIMSMHTVLLNDLENHILSKKSIGSIFNEFIPSMKMYKGYLENYQRRMTARAELVVQNGTFSLFLDKVRSCDRCKVNSIESYLVEPVQRIPRYELLLENVRCNIIIN